jgi:hypothetical protein
LEYDLLHHGPPKPWCIEHEIEVPEFWRDPDRVEAEED